MLYAAEVLGGRYGSGTGQELALTSADPFGTHTAVWPPLDQLDGAPNPTLPDRRHREARKHRRMAGDTRGDTRRWNYTTGALWLAGMKERTAKGKTIR